MSADITACRSSATRPTSVPGPSGISRSASIDRYSSEPPDAQASRKWSASCTKICPASAWHSRIACSTTVSKIGWSSKSERPTARSTSLVAVCCSSSSSSFLERSSIVESAGRRDGEPRMFTDHPAAAARAARSVASLTPVNGHQHGTGRHSCQAHDSTSTYTEFPRVLVLRTLSDQCESRHGCPCRRSWVRVLSPVSQNTRKTGIFVFQAGTKDGSCKRHCKRTGFFTFELPPTRLVFRGNDVRLVVIPKKVVHPGLSAQAACF